MTFPLEPTHYSTNTTKSHFLQSQLNLTASSSTTTMPNRPHKSFFMPIFCNSSINDAVPPPKFNSTTDPSSPKLTCIGQIKKKSSSTTTTTATVKSTVTSHRYTKLHKLFSSKNLISPVIDAGGAITSVNKPNNKCVTKRSKSYNGRVRAPMSNKKFHTSRDDLDAAVAEEELDPPLPVVRCRRRDEKSNVNLWKRRGIEMKTLQIQPIHMSMNRIGSCNNGGFMIPTSATTF